MVKPVWVVVLAALLVLGGGCATSAPARSGAPSQRSAPSSAGSSSTAAASLNPVPPIEFANPSGIDQAPDALPAVGSRPSPASYQVFLGPGHVASIRWVDTMLNDKLQPVLTIALDKSGSAAIAKWTEAHAGSPMLVLVSGRFLSMPMISGPLTSGSLQLTGNDDTAVRKLLESESVWAK